MTGILYIVATPIGNLEDITLRALSVLKAVDVIAAEDTRHSQRLLQHYGIGTGCLSLHEHNEEQRANVLLQRLQKGENVALISDAGTPLISDPGFRLVQKVQEAGVRVSPIPGPCAAIAALSASGLATDQFLFLGFLTSQSAKRLSQLETLVLQPATLIFYESVHRIEAFLAQLLQVFGGERRAVIAREMTKTFETLSIGSLEKLTAEFHQTTIKGEFVVLVEGMKTQALAIDWIKAEKVLGLLLEALPLKKAVSIAASVLDVPRNDLYERALVLKKSE